jgi:hypothetical protein
LKLHRFILVSLKVVGINQATNQEILENLKTVDKISFIEEG